MQPMGALQPGLPVPTMIPQNWKVLVIDLKDFFFSIPLHPQDTQSFAFTIPAENHAAPDERYEWRVLSQCMTNSPTLCQLYVAQVILPVRQQFPEIKVLHYMDDILLATQDDHTMLAAFTALQKQLTNNGLQIAPEKIQSQTVVQYLGLKVTPTKVMPLDFNISTHDIKTLNDLQRLCGHLNWIRPYCKLTTEEMQPLFGLLEGDSNLNSPRQLTTQAKEVIFMFEQRLKTTAMQCCEPAQEIQILIFIEFHYPYALLWQGGPLLFIYPHNHLPKVILPYGEALGNLAIQTANKALELSGRVPH